MKVSDRIRALTTSPTWRVLRWILVALGFLFAWTGWTGPELIDRLTSGFLQSDAFRTALVIAGMGLIVIVVLLPPPFRPEEWVTTYDGRLVRRKEPAVGYSTGCQWSESKWWLTLSRPSEGPARFLVTISFEHGGAAHTEFWQADRTIVTWFPEHFEGNTPESKPFGKYSVKWDIYPNGGDHDVVETSFTWDPFPADPLPEGD